MSKDDRELLRELQDEIARLKEEIAEQAHAIKETWRSKRHTGANRPQPEPDRIEEITVDHCESCGSTNLEECGVLEEYYRGDPTSTQDQGDTVQPAQIQVPGLWI